MLCCVEIKDAAVQRRHTASSTPSSQSLHKFALTLLISEAFISFSSYETDITVSSRIISLENTRIQYNDELQLLQFPGEPPALNYPALYDTL